MQADLRRSWVVVGAALVVALLLVVSLARSSSSRLRPPRSAENWFRTPSGAPITLDESAPLPKPPR